MGWCHEFGPDISDHCDHPMTAGSSHCFCETCGVICEGRFAGCAEVWARGPKDVALIHPRSHSASHASAFDTAATEADDAVSEIDAFSESDEVSAEGFVATSRHVPDVVKTAAVVDDRMVANLIERIGEHVDERVRAALEEYRGEVERAQPAGVAAEFDMSRLADVSASVEAGCRTLLTALDASTHELHDSLAGIRSLAVELREGLQVEAGGALKESVGEIQQITSELRQELAQLAAFRRALSDGYPAVARAVEHASVKAATRFAELTRSITELAATTAVETPNGHATSGNGSAEVDVDAAESPSQWS